MRRRGREGCEKTCEKTKTSVCKPVVSKTLHTELGPKLGSRESSSSRARSYVTTRHLYKTLDIAPHRIDYGRTRDGGWTGMMVGVRMRKQLRLIAAARWHTAPTLASLPISCRLAVMLRVALYARKIRERAMNKNSLYKYLFELG